jgi:hypothetical protein
MNSLQQMSGTRREYRLKKWHRAFYLLLGGIAIAGGVFLALKIISEPDGSVIAAIIMLFPVLGLYVTAWALRARLVIDGARIEVRGALKQYSADLSQIEGFRTINPRNDSGYTQLCLKQSRGKITVSQAFDTDDDYRAWLQQLTDLDKRDLDVLLDDIIQDAELGSSPEERLNALKQARNASIAVTVVAVAAAAGLNFGADSIRLPSTAVLALIPLVVLFLVRRSPVLYAVGGKKSDPRAELYTALTVAGFGLLFPAIDYNILSMRPLLLLIIPLALAYLAAFFKSARRHTSPAGAVFGLLFIAIIYSYPLVVLADTMIDSTKSSTYIVPVTGKHATSGKSTTYYLNLAPWGPLQEPNEINVSSSMYDGTSAGDSICLALHPGRLHAPWYQLTDCPTQPAPAQ